MSQAGIKLNVVLERRCSSGCEITSGLQVKAAVLLSKYERIKEFIN